MQQLITASCLYSLPSLLYKCSTLFSVSQWLQHCQVSNSTQQSNGSFFFYQVHPYSEFAAAAICIINNCTTNIDALGTHFSSLLFSTCFSSFCCLFFHRGGNICFLKPQHRIELIAYFNMKPFFPSLSYYWFNTYSDASEMKILIVVK